MLCVFELCCMTKPLKFVEVINKKLLQLQHIAYYFIFSLSELTGIQNANQIIDAGLNVQFCNMIAKLCREIATLYGLDEYVEDVVDDAGIQSLLFDLSAFLGELG